MNGNGQTICLNMIVKNEAPVIRRCLDSVRPLIDTWVIVDTGSTDGTQEIIREHLSDLPGELIERPWVDFAHNRTEALEFAHGRADYIFVIDADETVELADGFQLPHLTADSYNIEVRYGGYSYLRKQLVRDGLPWRYSGVLHEYIHCPEARTEALLEGIRTCPRHDGARARDPNTYRRDALILERALIDEPDNSRYVFYLAQSYRDAGDLERAVLNYRRRVEMGGWPEEVWFSLYQIAKLNERLERPWPEVLRDYLAAYEYQRDRAEPLFHIGVHHQRIGEYATAHLFLARAMEIPHPGPERLFVERPVYEYLLPIEYAVAAFYVGDHAVAIETCNTLLRSDQLPPEVFDRIVRNRRFSLDVIHPKPADRVEGRVRVVLLPRDPTGELDDAIDSLAQQEDREFDAVVVDDGTIPDLASRVPTDPRFRIFRVDSADTVEADDAADRALAAFVELECAPVDAVVPLEAGLQLAGRDVVARIRAAFEDPGCELLYGPCRHADGRLDHAEPAPDAATLDARGTALLGRSPLIFRARAWHRTREAQPREPVDRAALLRTAGFEATRYDDAPLTILADAAVRPTPRVVAISERALPDPAEATSKLPRISCLLVTRDRLTLAKTAIRSFAEQTYENRELIVVSEAGDRYHNALARFVDAQGIENVRFIRAETGLSLGALRNLSIGAASGEIVCQWDDDDISHPDRLAVQAARLLDQQARACFFTDHLHLLEHDRLIFWIDWTLGGQVTDHNRFFPGSVMMYREDGFRYPEDGPHARQGEDSVLADAIFRAVPVAEVGGMGHLYLYRYHGRNTFSQEHHYRMTTCSLPGDVIREKEEEIRRFVRYYPIPRPATVASSDGPVFVIG